MRRNETLFDFADWLSDPPTGGRTQMWLLGGFASAIITGYGLTCCVTERATTLNITTRGFPSFGRGLWLELNGTPAMTFGLLISCIGLFVHFQWFWGNDRRLVRYHQIAKFCAATAVVATSIAYLFAIVSRT